MNRSEIEGPVETAEDYLLGCDAQELARLAFQHRVWAQQSYQQWERAGFGYGARVLDLGCGPGFASLDLAHLLGPEGRVIAVDGSEAFLAYLARQAQAQGVAARIETRQADLHEMELEPESLDGAYARWVFCFLRDPAEVVRRVAAALRPGAALAITDYFNYRAFTFGPRSAILDRVVAAVEQSWLGHDGDLAIQGRMPGILRHAGLRVTEVHASHRVARPGSPLWNWPRTFFDGFLPKLVEMKLITPEDRSEFDRAWQQRSADPSSFLSIPPMIDLVAVKP